MNLQALYEVEKVIPALLQESIDSWLSLDIDYEPPHVERLWRPYTLKDGSGVRICLHRIHPCEKALLHPHPWPSAVRILSGEYEMGVAGINQVPLSGETLPAGKPLAIIRLKAGSSYEMTNKFGWHYVKPLGEVSLSIMVMGKLYPEQPYDHSEFGKGITHKELSWHTKEYLMREFLSWRFRMGE